MAVLMYDSFGDSAESVDMTIKELSENLKQVIVATGASSRKRLRHAKIVGIPCDVSNPEDVTKLANFAVNELGSIDIWVGKLLLFFPFILSCLDSSLHF